MELHHWNNQAASTAWRPDLVKLIRKLRWIGLEAEARLLLGVVRDVAPQNLSTRSCDALFERYLDAVKRKAHVPCEQFH